MEKRMQVYLTSAAWRGSICYLTCQVGGIRATCNNTNEDMRCCPTNNEVCQVQCWSTLTTGNHEVPLYGYDKLGKWGTSVEAVMNGSRHSYDIFGNFLEKPAPQATVSDWMRDFPDPFTSKVQIPVCRSRNLIVQPLEHPDENIKNFGCTCGGWMSNETSQFLDVISMGRQSMAYKHGWLKETLTGTCMRVCCRRS
ncbi:uncharacterized protein LY89DRAFT_252722 [Mollisia scopiformis]|uniref:Uncharacterized protein n=1 Tax=Mollisia scopiformis TaxID=149040 RepID=A0A194WSL5_MOLSC|nr:uncharacterized protein LY89DRAFT_252722 [Mollisia scopiformis]KUJ10950.1 hypothetical protein LY89DRAFT_252722 [Mollisia scopiformis]